MKLAVGLFASLLLAGCSAPPTLQDTVQAAKSKAAAPISGPSSSGSVCADLFIQAQVGQPAPGALACMTADFAKSWRSVGIKDDQDLSAKLGAFTQMTGWRYVGRDVKDHLVYDTFNKKGTVVEFIVFLDPSGSGLVADCNFYAYTG